MSWDDSTPGEGGGPEGEETPGDPTASRSRWGEEGHGRGGDDKNPTLTRPTQDQAPDGGDAAAPRGAKERENLAAAARTNAGDRGAGHPSAHPTCTALAAAAGGLVGGDRASQGGGTDGARHTPAQTPAAAQAVMEGDQVRARPAPEARAEHQPSGGDDTLWRSGATERTTDKAMAECAPPERPREPNVSGRQ